MERPRRRGREREGGHGKGAACPGGDPREKAGREEVLGSHFPLFRLSSQINGVSATCLRRGHPKALQDSATGVPSVLLENLDAPSLQRQIPAGGFRERRDNGPEVPAEGELIAAPEPAPREKLGGGSRREFCPGAGRAEQTRLHPQQIPGSTFPGPWCSFLGHTAFPGHPEPPVLLLSREDGGGRLWNRAPKLSGGEGKVSHPREQGRARGVPVTLWSPALSHLVVPQKRGSGHRHLPPPKTGRKGRSKGKYSWQIHPGRK